MTQRALVRQADVKRAVRGAISAGLTVTGVRVDDAGVTVLTDAGGEARGSGPGFALGRDAIRAALKKARERGGKGENTLLRRS
jgi:hypothetical protein